MSKKIVIYQEWGGLGDNLAHSTIPRLCEKYGYDCYLSKYNKFNNDETYELLFKDIPFIDEKDMSWLDRYTPQKNKEWNHLRSIQIGYGFNEAPYSYPFINYTPKFNKELKDKTLVDLSGTHYFTFFKQYFSKEHILNVYNRILSLDKFANILQVEKNNYNDIGSVYITNEKYKINSLFDYCDALYSCKNFITVDSGQSNLASGIKHQFNTKTNIYTIGLQRNLPPNNYDSYFYLNTNHIAIDTGIMHKAVDSQ
tara:strand:+ start:6396 stop:7157 length:762 start_codon:yes stop_codon:yes gene_type:complete